MVRGGRGRAGHVLATLTSSDMEIYLEHVPSVWSQTDKMKKYKNWKSYALFSVFAKNVNDIELHSTIHKSKGLEFDTVCLLNDFTELREMSKSRLVACGHKHVLKLVNFEVQKVQKPDVFDLETHSS